MRGVAPSHRQNWIYEIPEDLREAVVARIVRKSNPTPGGCLAWGGQVSTRGYGVVSIVLDGKQKRTQPHRLLWIATHGSIEPGLEVDHTCRNRLCVNIEHLDAVTPEVNNYRSHGRSEAFSEEDCYCRQHGRSNGYPYWAKYYWEWKCRICTAAYNKKRAIKRRGTVISDERTDT